MRHDPLRKKWAASAGKLLVGRTIVAVEYMDPQAMQAMFWDRAPIVLILDNGLRLFPSSDDEGNAAGALYTTSDDLPCIPVI